MTTTELQAPIRATKPKPSAAPVSSDGQPSVRNPELMQEVRDMVHAQVEDTHQADPRAAVETVLQELVSTKRYDVLAEAAREGLLDIAWGHLRQDKSRRPIYREGRSAKWEARVDAMGDNRDIFEAVVYTGTEVKYLGDCTKADLTAGAEVKSKQANTMLDNAERMTKLAGKLKAGQVVSDLGRETVEGIFDA